MIPGRCVWLYSWEGRGRAGGRGGPMGFNGNHTHTHTLTHLMVLNSGDDLAACLSSSMTSQEVK